MRFLTIVLILLLTSCSWSLGWPWGSNKTGNCLDDNSCDTSNPFEEKLIGGTWYCYGADRREPWDCSQTQDDNKIVFIVDKPKRVTAPPASVVAIVDKLQQRAEMSFQGENISSESTSSPAESMPEQIAEIALPESPGSTGYPAVAVFDGFSDDSYAVQLIALQTIEEIEEFATIHDIEPITAVKIRSQGVDWHVLILDIFEDKAMADQAAHDWAQTHEPDSKPWVRQLGPLKEAAQSVDAAGA